MKIDSSKVAAAHDAMAEEYDQLEDLWYPWLFAQVHEFIATHLPVELANRPTALDVGCGTGAQSFLLARAGYDVIGIDIAKELLKVARSKCSEHAVLPLGAPPLFTSSVWDGIGRHHEFLSQSLERARGGRLVKAPEFLYANVDDFDLGHDKFDVIVSCGSVLSFLDNYEGILKKMIEGLKQNGVLFLEVEQKINLDLLWPIVDNIIGGRLGYEQGWSEILHNLLAPPGRSVQIEFPFELHSGETVVLPMWLFSVGELGKLFDQCHADILDRIGVHWATNLVPSTMLHKTNPGIALREISRVLQRADRLFGKTWPAYRLGCSILFALRKK